MNDFSAQNQGQDLGQYPINPSISDAGLDVGLKTTGLQPEGQANTALVLSVIALVVVLVIGAIALPKLLTPTEPTVMASANQTTADAETVSVGDPSLIGDDILAVGANGAVLRLDKAQFEGLIKDYILNNGETVIQSVQNFQATEQQREQERGQEKLSAIKDELLSNPDAPVLGNPKGDITVVEFLDYNCGYCKRAYETVDALIAQDPNVRVVIKEFPILAPSSKTAALVALAANRLGKYSEVHHALLTAKESLTDESIQKIVEGVGLNWAEVKALSEDPAFSAALDKNIGFAEELNIRGTPGFIIGDQIIPGAIELPQMITTVEAERAKLASKPEDTQGKETDAIAVPTAPTPELETESVDEAEPKSFGDAVPESGAGETVDTEVAPAPDAAVVPAQ